MADRLNPDRVEAPQKVSTQRMRLWQALSDFILAGGGWVTSPPYGRFVRIECNQGLSLPVELEKAGHRLRHAGMTTRIDGGAFHTVDVLELDLSGVASISAIGGKADMGWCSVTALQIFI
jgi:hypothetical protein